ncbi:MAG: hypothetical protein ACE5JT_04415 [Nitrosopumilaceae archaeon]
MQSSYTILVIILSVTSGTLAFSLDSTERVPVSNPKIVNALGIEIDYLTVDHQVQITGDVSNAQDIEQPFVFIVQIKNQQDAVVSLSWISGSLFPDQTFTPAVSWTPNSSGEYKIQMFVWRSLSDADALSPMLEISAFIN